MTSTTSGDGNPAAGPDRERPLKRGGGGTGHEHAHAERPGAPMGAPEWDRRYAGTGLVWGGGANRWVIEQVAGLVPGRAVDLACGEGRNTVYLAGMGWHVTGVDFSGVALGKAGQLAESQLAARPAAGSVSWVRADITTYRPDPVDLALVVYVHLPRAGRAAVLRAATGALAPGGTLLVIGHNTRNIAEGAGGPEDAQILYTAADIVGDLAGIDPALAVDVASEPLREVAGAPRAAIDTVVRAHRP